MAELTTFLSKVNMKVNSKDMLLRLYKKTYIWGIYFYRKLFPNVKQHYFAYLKASWAACHHLYIVRLCWLAGAVASSPEAQRTSLYLPPSLYQHFHVPSHSLTPPLSSPPLSSALVSLQLCFKSSVLHLLFHPYVFALLTPSLISFRVQWQHRVDYKMKQNIVMLKIQKETAKV